MNRRELENTSMIQRVVHFGTTRENFFPPDSVGGQAFAELGSSLSVLSERAGALIFTRNAVSASTAQRDAARESLRAGLQRINQTAVALAIDVDQAAHMFRMPRTTSCVALLNSAKSFVTAAEPLKAQFLAHKLPQDFIEQVREQSAILQTAVAEQDGRRAERRAALMGVRRAMRDCLVMLKRVDVVVANTLPDAPELTAEWETARHVTRRPRRKKASTGKTTPPAGDANPPNQQPQQTTSA